MNDQHPSSEIVINQAIKDYLLRELKSGEIKDLSNEDSLIANRILDSLKIVKLRVFLEERFNLTIYPEEVIPENFETIAAIKSFVFRKS